MSCFEYWTAKQRKGFVFNDRVIYSDLSGICSLLLIPVLYPLLECTVQLFVCPQDEKVPLILIKVKPEKYLILPY